ncbi:antibiotic biosynthesis monooxygenase [Aspergillus udagawae]|nr:antibiotic biosynthesis monooxygenase [Aspergillus udagawae]
MATFSNIDPENSFLSQLEKKAGPIVLMDTVIVPNGQHDAVLALWEKDSHIRKSQPGFLHAQLHKGIDNSNLILNIATWESVEALCNAYQQEIFQKTLEEYPKGTIIYQHIVQKVAVLRFH